MDSRTYSHDELLDLAEYKPNKRPEVSVSGHYTGIALPKGCQEHALITSFSARRLGAQLLLEAELYDAIYEAGVESSQGEISYLSSLLRQVFTFTSSRWNSAIAHTEEENKMMAGIARAIGEDWEETLDELDEEKEEKSKRV